MPYLAKKNSQHDTDSLVALRESQNIKLKAKSIIDGVFPPEIDTTLVQNSVIAALSWNMQQAMKLMQEGDFDIFHYLPQAMKQDENIAITAVKKYPHIYNTLSTTLKNKPEIKKLALSQRVKSWTSIIWLIDLVESDKKTSLKMRLFLAQLLETKQEYFSDTVSHILYQLYLSDLDLYKKIISKWLFDSTISWVTLWNKCIAFLRKKTKSLEVESQVESWKLLLEILWAFLEIPDLQKHPLLYQLCEQVIWWLNIVKISWEEEENVDDLQLDWDENILEDQETEASEYYSQGPYSVCDTWNYCKLWDSAWKSITLEKSTYNSMSDTSLENYMNFALKMRSLGLWFLLEKHLSAIQVATEINFFTGEWMSDARTLMFLNKIWKRLWVPQSAYEDTDWNREILCFHDIGSAYFRFREIAWSWKVWKFHFDVSKRGANTIVELFLKRIWVIGPNSGGLSVVAFRESKLDII